MPHTPASPRRRRPDARPEEILDAALVEFGLRGLGGSRVSDIAARAGVAKGTVYLYFETKDDLFRGVVLRAIGDAVQAMREAAVGDSATARLEAVLPVFWRFVRSDGFLTVYRLITGELHQFPELTQFYSREIGGQTTQLFADHIAEGVSAGEFRALEPTTAARMLVALLVKHAHWMARPDLYTHLADTSDHDVLADISAFFFAALRP